MYLICVFFWEVARARVLCCALLVLCYTLLVLCCALFSHLILLIQVQPRNILFFFFSFRCFWEFFFFFYLSYLDLLAGHVTITKGKGGLNEFEYGLRKKSERKAPGTKSTNICCCSARLLLRSFFSSSLLISLQSGVISI